MFCATNNPTGHTVKDGRARELGPIRHATGRCLVKFSEGPAVIVDTEGLKLCIHRPQ